MSEPSSDSTSSGKPGATPSKLLSYLRLGRAPNVFTAMADVLMGYWFTHPVIESPWPLVWLLAASSCLYTAGMVLNDVFDVEEDRRERPQRPLPSGRIDWAWARTIGFALLGAGLVCGAVAGYWPGAGGALAWRPLVLATAIAAAVLLYDGGLKRTPFGPLGMGLCRFLNVLLGMSLAGTVATSPATLHYATAELVVAAGIGVYIVGVTWFARTEATESARLPLAFATAVMAAGIVWLGLLPEFLPPRTLLFTSNYLWPGLLAMLFVTILRGALGAIADPSPQRVQGLIKHAIMSLILFDAAVTMAMRGGIPALCVLALLLPMNLLGRWVYST